MKWISKGLLAALFAQLLISCTHAPIINESPMDPEPDIPPPTTEWDDTAYTPEASAPKLKKTWKEKYSGFTGFFTRPPIFVLPGDQLAYQRCNPVKILGFRMKAGQVIMKVKQGPNVMDIYGLNRQPLKLNKKNKIAQLDRYFVKKLDLVNPGRVVASIPKICAGSFWQQMSKKEFLFLSGDPDQVKVQTTSQGKHEQWIYNGHETHPSVSYYFVQSKLYSWKQ
jgi:hypothetical protein